MSKDRFKITVAVNLILRRDDEILLLKRTNTGNQDGMYNLIAGHLEKDELGTEAIIREAREETSITIEPSDLKFVHFVQRLPVYDNDEEYIDLFYEASVWQGDVINNEPDKCDGLDWFQIDNLPNNTIPLLPVIIKKINNGQMYSEYKNEPI